MYKDPKLSFIASYIPSSMIENTKYIEKFETTESFVKNKIGVMSKAIKAVSQNTSDLCCEAYSILEKQKGYSLEKKNIDLVCVVTQNPDYNIPHTAAIVHSKLELSDKCVTFDISQGCAGYTYALNLIMSFMKNNNICNALLFTADPYSGIVNPDSKNEFFLFGDAASVSLISTKYEGFSLIDSEYGIVRGSYKNIICSDSYLKMDGFSVIQNVLNNVPNSIDKILARNHFSRNTIDLFAMHQASKYIIELLRKKMNVSDSKMPFVAQNYGNTISSSIPILLKENGYFDNSKIENIILSGFGVGFTYGNCLLKR